MKVKVCGMRDPKNIKAMAALPIDFMGFIFYEKSPRNVDTLMPENMPQHIDRVGVFVNSDIDFIIKKINFYHLNFIQLHGDESPEYCDDIQSQTDIQIIKAFRIDDTFDFKILKRYETSCTYFLFDTKAKQYGGTGKKFDWNILEKYTGDTPFLLSGGIDTEDARTIRNLNFNNMAGVDVNSKFELQPALKDVQKIENFLEVLMC